MEWLNSLVRAQEKFRTQDEYPLIDDSEVLSEGEVFKCWPWTKDSPRKTANADRLMECALTSDHSVLSVRYTYLNLFYHLAHFAAEDVAVDIQDRDEAPEYREQFLRNLKTLVGLIKEEASDYRDPRRIRWETCNACAAQDWNLAETLFQRLEQVSETDIVPRIWAMRGRQELLAVFAQSWKLDGLGLKLWFPNTEKGLSNPADRFLCLRSIAPEANAVGSHSPEERNRLEDAAHQLAKGIKGRFEDDLVFRFLLLRCRAAIGEFLDAAADCEELLRHRDEFARYDWMYSDCAEFVVYRLYALAVHCYEAGGQIERAITASGRWLTEFQGAPGIHELRARLFQQQGDLASAYKCLREEIDSNPRRGDDPAISMALRFGELYDSPEAQWKRFRRNLDHDEVELVRSLVAIHWPRAGQMVAPNFDGWVNASCLLLKRVPDDPSLAIFSLGRIVENELRTRIFERFRATIAAGILSESDKDSLTNFVRFGERGYMSLEQMLNEMKYREARSAAGRKFREWLQRQTMVGLLQRMDLKSLGELNNRAKHRREPLLTWKEAETMAQISHQFLDVLLTL